ncbi:protein FAM229B-like [Leucoraja erinacea]|uniref:protein FAM229B-like n=1 Tax=Leucoraja erinaceus TaxID=7782 RepID=UPI002457E190|nr:protein FAM229B-like [Leucoraja erinacea]XP_055491745.1 protein FAM229B-like [Leucoraja erinacea]
MTGELTAVQSRRFLEAGDCLMSVERQGEAGAMLPRLGSTSDWEACAEILPSPHHGRQLRRCNGSHCLTITNVPIDVYVTMGRPSNLQYGQAS